MFLLDHLLFLHGGVRFADRRKEKKGKVRYVGDLGELNENISIIICRGTDDNFFSSYFFLLIKNDFSTDDDLLFSLLVPQIPLYCLLLALSSFAKVIHKTPSPSYDICYTSMYYRSFYNISNYKAARGPRPSVPPTVFLYVL